jgi:hypothetical protein
VDARVYQLLKGLDRTVSENLVWYQVVSFEFHWLCCDYRWIDLAFWHILFSVLLLVIMILWRPTNNNQRYAFTPLLDNDEDEEDGKLLNKENVPILGIFL